MFFIALEFSDNKSQASHYMQEHNNWIRTGFDDGVFLVSGSLASGSGGAIIAHNTSPTELEKRVANDPFVAQNIVTATITEISVARTDKRLEFLLTDSD